MTTVEDSRIVHSLSEPLFNNGIFRKKKSAKSNIMNVLRDKLNDGGGPQTKPDKLVINISNDYNINSLNYTITCFLKKEKKNISEEASSKYTNYFEETKNLLDEFNNSDSKEKKTLILIHYLLIAEKYYPIEITRDEIIIKECMSCSVNLEEIEKDINGVTVCPNCGTENIITSEEKKKEKVRNTGDDENNFRKALIQYQGKQNISLPSDLFKKLDEFFERKGISKSDEIKLRELDSRGRRKGTNIQMIYSALYEIKNPELYEHSRLIAKKYWGWELVDISSLEEQAIYIYRETSKRDTRKKEGRSSNLNMQFRLYKILQLCGHECFSDDFKIVQMEESIEMHEKIWKDMCDACNDERIYYM